MWHGYLGKHVFAELCKAKEPARAGWLADKFSVRHDSMNHILQRLRKTGHVERIGKTSGARWRAIATMPEPTDPRGRRPASLNALAHHAVTKRLARLQAASGSVALDRHWRPPQAVLDVLNGFRKVRRVTFPDSRTPARPKFAEAAD